MAQCPVPANAIALISQSQNQPSQIPSGVSLFGGTKMTIGVGINKTWNNTTKQFEWMSRPRISQGPTAEKVFRFGPSKLL